jgi:FkbM family methyltransferase
MTPEALPSRLVDVRLDRLDRSLTIEVHSEHDAYISEELIAYGHWEPFETELVLRLLPAGGVLVDCGANIGWYSLVAAATGHSVIAIEPEPGNLAVLDRNIERNGLADRVEVHACALAGHEGVGELELSADNQGDHRVSAAPGRDTVEIKLDRLDRIVGERRVDVIKVDTQGSEVGVLRGSSRLLADEASGISMILEYWPFGLRECGASAEELVGLLTPFVGITHSCFLISEEERSLQPVTLATLVSLAQRGDYSPESGGHTNLLVVPHAQIDEISDLVATGRTLDGDDVAAAARDQLFQLRLTEHCVYSQHGEDGVIAELARRTNCAQVMVELGAGSGDECNSRALREQGWRVIALDGNPEGSSWVRTAFLDAENTGVILRDSVIDDSVGVLSIDLDGNDFWILLTMPDEMLPTVLVMEYNATVGPVEPLTVRYRPRRVWDHSNHFGASLAALTMLASHRGLDLVYCDSVGVNAYFVARSALADAGLVAVPVTEAYRPPQFGLLSPVGEFRGHEPSTRRFVHLASVDDAYRSFDVAIAPGLRGWVRRRIDNVGTADWWRLRKVWTRNRLRNLRAPSPTK